MSKIRIHTIDEAGAPFPAPAGRAIELKPAEVRALVDGGVWREAGDPDGWIVQTDDGEVYAGREACVAGATYAKVRGKGGRRLGQGRWSKPEGEKRERVSFALLPSVRQRLAELAEKRGTSMSLVLEDLITHAEE